MKQCSKCKTLKEFTEFHSDKAKATGYRSTCKKCDKSGRVATTKPTDPEYNRLYRQKNREYLNNYKKEWNQKNKTSINEYMSKRRSKMKTQTPELTTNEMERVTLLYKWAQELPGDWHVDHIVPLNKGGLHHPDNLQLIPAEENRIKKDKTPQEYYGHHYEFMVCERPVVFHTRSN